MADVAVGAPQEDVRSVGGMPGLPAVSDSWAPNYLALVGLPAVALLALTTGAWYARRRWGR